MAEDMFAQKGWICPKCGRVLAPSTMYCLWCCRDMKESITTTGTTIPKWDTTPITVVSGMIDSNGTGQSYFVKTSSISRDSHEITKDEPQQKSCATCKHALGNWDGESNNCGRCCGADRRFYEPIEDEQTERSE